MVTRYHDGPAPAPAEAAKDLEDKEDRMAVPVTVYTNIG